MTGSHYSVLGLAPSATPDQVRRAYRTLAKRLHPDVSQEKDAQAKFAAVAAAYETLNDPAKRSAYDRELERQSKVGATGGGANADLRAHYSWRNVAGTPGPEGEAPTADIDELYDTFFGGPKPEKTGKPNGSKRRTPGAGQRKTRG